MKSSGFCLSLEGEMRGRYEREKEGKEGGGGGKWGTRKRRKGEESSCSMVWVIFATRVKRKAEIKICAFLASCGICAVYTVMQIAHKSLSVLGAHVAKITKPLYSSAECRLTCLWLGSECAHTSRETVHKTNTFTLQHSLYYPSPPITSLSYIPTL